MVVVIDGHLGFFVFGFGAVAIEFGFGEEVGAFAFYDAQGAFFQSRADGGDAGAEGVVAFADGEAGAAEFVDLAGTGGVGVPADVSGQVLDVVAQRFVAAIVFAGKPEDVVAIDDAPDGGEGIAEAEVDAADGTALRPLSRYSGRGVGVRVRGRLRS